MFVKLQTFIPEVNMEVLIVDQNLEKHTYAHKGNFHVLKNSDLCGNELGRSIYEKYFNKDMDKLRWSLKPVLVDHLLDEKYERVIYIDSDIYFFKNPTFLFKKLHNSNIILTPHWRSFNIWDSPKEFYMNHRHGLFNAGFIGCNRHGRDAMKWWAKSCAFMCEKNMNNGMYDDQSYLNVFPVLFKNVEVLQHKGCNVANWNFDVCARRYHNGEVVINNNEPIIFVHMTFDTMKGVFNGEDPMLKGHLQIYSDAIKSLNPNIDLFTKYSTKKKSIFKRLFFLLK